MPKTRSVPKTWYVPTAGDLRRSREVPGSHSSRDRFAIAQGFRFLRMLRAGGDHGAHFLVVRQRGISWTGRCYTPPPKSRRGKQQDPWGFATLRIRGLEGRKAVVLGDQWRCA